MRILKEGDRGSTVELLQWGLERGGVPLYLDGIFGPGTNQAVKTWQTQNGLMADGIVGTETWESLYPSLTGLHYHTVRWGDTIHKLAQQYGSTAIMIETANPHINPMQLAAGQTLCIPSDVELVPANIRWSFDLLSLVVDSIRCRFPFIGISVIGYSELRRPIYQLTIGRGRTRVGYNAAHHANEWITTPVLLRFLEQYAGNVAYEKNVGERSFRKLFQDYMLDIVPMVNPDGLGLA